jgi:hypothetical protein
MYQHGMNDRSISSDVSMFLRRGGREYFKPGVEKNIILDKE